MHKKILVASGNAHKIAEIAQIIPTRQFCTPHELGISIDVVEDGKTFLDNALIKAKTYFSACFASNLTVGAVLAEDSGICVDALDGRPGIYSARYGMENPHAREDARKDSLYQCKLLLQEMQGLRGLQARSARFVCAAVFMWSAHEFSCHQSSWEGAIIEGEPSGAHGFGYDPVFFLPEFDCTSAELHSTEKNLYSHRAKAMRALFAQHLPV